MILLVKEDKEVSPGRELSCEQSEKRILKQYYSDDDKSLVNWIQEMWGEMQEII